MLFHRKNKEQRTSFHSKEKEKKPFIQPKLKMGTKGDKYEVEADKMADKVVNNDVVSNNTIQKKEGEEEVQQKSLAAEISPLIQKKEDAEEEPIQKAEEEESIQAKEEEEPIQKLEEDVVQKKEEEEVQTKEEEEVQAKSNNNNNKSPSIEGKLRNGSGGTKMDAQTKNKMESGFGADFSQVNIHKDDEAAQMSQNLGAQAFTHGNDVYFNKGKYNPDTKEGKHLLAHELTHTVQQKGMIQKKENELFIQRNIQGTGKVPYGEFKINMNKVETPAASKSGEKGTIKFTPNKKSPNTKSIKLVQIVKDLNISATPNVDYNWIGVESDRNNVQTASENISYKTKNNDTLKKISKKTTKGHITPLEIHAENSAILGGFDENKKIAKDTNLKIPKVQKGYFIDHSASSAKATPKTNKNDTDIPLAYREYYPNTADSRNGFKKSKKDIKEASLWDFPRSGGDRIFSFETIARSIDKGFDYGTIHWNFRIKNGIVDKTSFKVVKGTSATFKESVKEFNKFYKNRHTVIKGDSLIKLAKLYYNDGKKWKDIKTANKLKSSIIKHGQKLIIPRITKQ